MTTDQEKLAGSYDIEPWVPSPSPGAPIPAPQYVPFNYGKMTPGNYYSHSLGYSGRHWDPKTIDSIYKEGVRVLYHDFAGFEFEHGGQKYYSVREKDVAAIIEKNVTVQ